MSSCKPQNLGLVLEKVLNVLKEQCCRYILLVYFTASVVVTHLIFNLALNVSLIEPKFSSVLGKCFNESWLCKEFAMPISLNLFSPQIHKIWNIIVVV